MFAAADTAFMRRALRLAGRGRGRTSPNPMVGAILVKRGRILGRGWHRQAGGPHAEIEALRDAQAHGQTAAGATLYVSLEPCCTHGRTPPCTAALIAAGVARVVAATVDPNPAHRGRGFRRLARAGIAVRTGLLAPEANRLNEAFNHWICHRTPWVTLKVAMTLDGKLATAAGESRWITGPRARRYAMRLRAETDALVVGINTVRADDPRLTVRPAPGSPRDRTRPGPYRVILDSHARTPLTARVVTDAAAARTIVVATRHAPARRVAALRRRVSVWIAPARGGRVSLRWVLRRLGAMGVVSALVEGGGEVHAAFLARRLAHRIAFFFAPKVLGGRQARKAVGGQGASGWAEVVAVEEGRWQRLGPDWLLTGRVAAA